LRASLCMAEQQPLGDWRKSRSTPSRISRIQRSYCRSGTAIGRNYRESVDHVILGALSRPSVSRGIAPPPQEPGDTEIIGDQPTIVPDDTKRLMTRFDCINFSNLSPMLGRPLSMIFADRWVSMETAVRALK
jgi:hypothetical protein